jgi:cell division protein FtsB
VSGKGTSTIKRPESPPRASDHHRSRLADLSRPIQIDRRIARRRRSTVLLAIIALAIAGALAAALFGLPIQTYLGQDDRLDQRRDQLAQLEAVNNDLRLEVERLATDDGVREAAREELGFVESGERRESILDLPPVPTELPDGWPYGLVNDIVALRTNPPTAPTP